MLKKYETILVKDDDGIVTITLNVPETMNALSDPMKVEIADVLETIDQGESMKVVVITGVGNAFCSGGDVGAGRTVRSPIAAERRYQRDIVGFQEKLRLFPMPTIAAVNGHAKGLGLWLAMLCDFVVASPSARFGVPQIRFNIHANGGSIKSMLEYVPYRWAVYHLLSGEDITAEEAERFFMVNKVVPQEQLLTEAYKLAEMMKDKNPVIVRFLKRSIWREKYLPYAEAVALDYMQTTWVSSIRREMGDTRPSGLEAMKAEKSRARGR
ncbi:MAG: enoyl-CoA hydratase/isomerase family protein [Chloroflexota bacterium]